MKCRKCGTGDLRVEMVEHHYTESGLPNVYLRNMPMKVCSECGAKKLSIPAIESLHRVIALALLVKNTLLSGDEVRYLRKYVGLSGVDFAKRIGTDPATISRWESGHQPIGAQSERLLRLLVVTMGQVQEYPVEQLDSLDSNKTTPVRLTLERTSSSWRSLAPALAHA